MNWTFQFVSLESFWHMAGHGPYVWSVYTVTALVLGIMLWWPLRQRRVWLRQQQRQWQQLQARSAEPIQPQSSSSD